MGEEGIAENNIAPVNSQKRRSKVLIFSVVLGIFLFLLASGIYWFQKEAIEPEDVPSIAQIEMETQTEPLIINENTNLQEEAIEDEKASKGMLASENYKINNINIGGSVMFLPNEENKILKINNVKSNSFLDDKKDEVKLIITWQTSKLAISEIEYAKNNGEDPKTIKEDSYGFGHSAVITGLDPGTPYVYQIKCKDRWGNGDVSEYFGAYTSSKAVSIFDLMFEEMKKIFSWAI